jgi:DNA polymerase-3 subunit delta'
MANVMAIKSFSQIMGQEKAVTFLKSAIAKGKIPHAYLFTGIPGVGKTTTALAFAQALNCDEPVNGDGCGRCRSCRQIMNNNFPDLFFIKPDNQNIKIDQIRELNRSHCFKRISGKYRVSIIDSADMMTEEAGNAFLKTLEEPPPGNVLILKVIEPLDLLDTIVSRCQKIPFRPLRVNIIKECLRNEKQIDEENALLLAKISQGSLGRAIDMWESDFLKERESSIGKLIKLSSISAEEALEMALEYSGRAKKTSTGGGKSKDVFELLGLWKTWYRDLITMKIGGPIDILVNSDFSRTLKKVATHFTVDDLIDSFFLLDQAQKDLMHARNLDLMMENTVLRLKRFAQGIP